MFANDASTQRPLGATGRAPVRTLLFEGLFAGLVLGLADLLATGPWRVPASLSFLVLASALAGGVAAGTLSIPVGRSGWPAALSLAGSVGLAGASVVTKELDGQAGLLAGVLFLSILSGVLAIRVARKKNGPGAVLVALICVPAGSLLASCTDYGGIWIAVGLALPAATLVALAGRGALVQVGAGLGLAALLPLPVLWLDPTPRQHVEGSPPETVAQAEKPDVVLVVIDTLRADAVDWTPLNPSTPGLAALAQTGVRFDSAIASAPWTLPAMASLFTGLLPSQHGAVDRLHALPDDAVTLAEQFRAAGYQTAAFTGGAFLDPGYGLAQGFEHFDPRSEYWFRPLRIHVPLIWRVVKNRFFPLRAVLRYVEEFGGLAATRERLARWQEREADGRPLFLLLHTYAVHDYYLYHPDPDDSVRARLGDPPGAIGERLSVHPEQLFTLDGGSLAWFEAIYRARIQQADRQLQAILGDIRALRSQRARLIVVTADHGEGFDAATGRVHHGGRLHDDLLRIPLVMTWEGHPESTATSQGPTLRPGRVVHEQVRQVDLAPTLLELAGIGPLPDGAGTSLLAPLRGADPFPPAAWAEEHLAGPRWLALRTPHWKLMDGPAGEQRFDLTEDPGELEPLPFPGLPELEELWSNFDRNYPARTRSRANIDPTLRDQLEHIGYGE